MQLSFKIIAASSLISAAGILGVSNSQTDTMSQNHMATTGHRNDSATTMSDKAGAHPKTAMKHPKPKLVPQKTCPVMGGPIDKSIYVDYKGKRVYFCCAMCPETFNKDPEKYLKVLVDRGEAVGDAPKK
jgi:YHS domain-containing protein